jgi:MFS family permease/uncharacterized damage-inducible protein DinB
MWIAAVASNIGTWMHTVGASWLMTTLAASPLLVALVQTATTLPVFLLGLPAGVMADLVDRRKLLLFTQTWMLAVAALLGVLVMFGAVGPWTLLALTFALGVGAAMNGPAWAAAIPELVPREELPAAVALNSVGFNIARAVGPALGGIVMAAWGAGAVFLANAISFLGVIVVLWSWKERPPAAREPGARFRDAMREGLIYVRGARPFHAVLARAGMFSFAGSALWAMLPVVARQELKTTSLGYGILLGCLGAGSVIGAAVLAPLRSRHSVDKIVAVGVVLFAIATMALAFLKTLPLAAAAMVVGGIAWLTVMSSFNVCAQTIPPQWMRARALAFYLLVFQGSLAVGSGLWGEIARRLGVRTSLLIAATAMVAGIAAGWRMNLSPTPITPQTEPPCVSMRSDAKTPARLICEKRRPMSNEEIFLKFSADKLTELLGRIETCLAKLTPEQIWTRGADNENAVGNLVLHLAGNVRQWIVCGVGGAEDHRDRDTEFDARFAPDALDKLRTTVAEAVAVLAALPHAKLADRKPIQKYYDVTLLEAIYHVVEHFSMHTGQIIFATKLLTGDDLGFYGHLRRSPAASA